LVFVSATTPDAPIGAVTTPGWASLAGLPTGCACVLAVAAALGATWAGALALATLDAPTPAMACMLGALTAAAGPADTSSCIRADIEPFLASTM
jgi:hypothetical protein